MTAALNPVVTDTDAKTAILFAAWERGGAHSPLGIPNLLLPLLGRPMLQRTMEDLVREGCRDIHIVLGDDPVPVRDFLGDGARWGCRLTWHLPMPDESFKSIMRRVGVRADRNYLLATGSSVPLHEDRQVAKDSSSKTGDAYFWHGNGSSYWSGRGEFNGAWLLARDIDAHYTAFEAAVLQDCSISRRYGQRPLSATSPAALLDSATRLLASSDGAANFGRQCDIHADARIVEPVHIGVRVKIASGAVVGPNVVLGDGSFVDHGTHLRDSIVMPDTYVGEALDLDHVVVRGSRMANIRLETLVNVQDRHLLADLPRRGQTKPSSRRLEHLAARALQLGLGPLHRLACALDHPTTPVAQTPRPFMAHFARRFYPGLSLVAAGEMSLVGPDKRYIGGSEEGFEAWRELHPKARYGLLNDAVLDGRADFSAETALASDAIACALQDRRRVTLSYLARYLVRVARDVSSGPRPRSKARKRTDPPGGQTTPPFTHDSTGA